MDQIKIGRFIAECRKKKKLNSNATCRKIKYYR